MNEQKISVIPEEVIDGFLSTPSSQTDTPPPPPPLKAERHHDEISRQRPPTEFQQQGDHLVHHYEQRQPRIRIQSWQEQLEMVTRLFEDHNDTLKNSDIKCPDSTLNTYRVSSFETLQTGAKISHRNRRGRTAKNTVALKGVLDEALFRAEVVRRNSRTTHMT